MSAVANHIAYSTRPHPIGHWQGINGPVSVVVSPESPHPLSHHTLHTHTQMAVPVPVAEQPGQPVQAAAVAAAAVAEGIRNIGARVAEVKWYAEAMRAALDAAAVLVDEDVSAAEILDADLWDALSHACRQAPIPEATAHAAAKLFARVSSGAPLLPGAIRAAGDFISTVFELCDQAPAAFATGLLSDAIRDLSVAFSLHGNVDVNFLVCAPHLHVRAGDSCDLTWLVWSNQTAWVTRFATEAGGRLSVVAWEAMDAAGLARSHCLVQSPERREHMRKLEMSLLVAIKYVDKAIVALDIVRDAVALKGQILHQVIGNGNAHVPPWP
uniref:Uncharacterized protein n=1 Tax=Oryza brachyantha TaxID=4533 RepID=J3LPV2_ORYBR